MNQNQYPNIDRYAQKSRQDQELEDMGIDSSSVEFNAPQTYEEFLNQNPGRRCPCPAFISSSASASATKIMFSSRGRRMRAA